MNKVLYEHYFRGEIKIFDRSLIQEIRNVSIYSNKPRGGFWASRCDAEFGWKDLCDSRSKGEPFIFSLTNNAKILSIKSKDDMHKLSSYQIGPVGFNTIVGYDFEMMQKDYDALEVDGRALFWYMYGWDCDSILIFNPDIIIEEVNEKNE